MSESVVHFVLFECGESRFALPQEDILEVLHYAELATAPSLPVFLEGFLNIEGRLCPVVNVARLIGLPVSPVELYSPILIVRGCDDRLALCVDEVGTMVRIARECVLPVPPGHTFQDCATGSIQWADQTHCVLAVDRLLTREEHERLAAFAAQESERLELLEAAP